MEKLEISKKIKQNGNILENDIKTIEVTTFLLEGPKVLDNWTRNFNQSASVIQSLKEGDKLLVTVSDVGPGTNCQLRIAWGSEDGQFISWNNCYKNGVPYDYEVVLTKEIIINIQTANILYLNGCNITIGKWTLTKKKDISTTRGNASTVIWSGSQDINWNSSPKTSIIIENSLFSNAQINMKLRMNYKDLKLGAQGRITTSSGSVIPDADTYENLTQNWGNYYEFIITNDMLSELKEKGIKISGNGYTLTSVELIDPMKEYVITAYLNLDDIKAWEINEGTPKLSIILTNFEEIEVNTIFSANLITDMFVYYNDYSIEVKLSPGETKKIYLEFPDLKPGFYRMVACINGNSLFTYRIGFDPTNIISSNDAQPDFWEFWDNWKKVLKAIDMKEEVSLLGEYSTGSRLVYEVKMMSIPDTKDGEPVPIWGYYAEPKKEGTYPCLIKVHGTDAGTGIPSVPNTDDDIEWCEFIFSARGQMLSRVKNGNKYKVNNETDFYSYGLGDNDAHYYRMAYLDTIRPIDFVWSRTKVNKHAIFVAGGSQGGCFSYVSAALSDGRVKAIAPSITGHADFIHTMEMVEWPTNKFNDWINNNYPNDYEKGKEALLKHQSYFDTKNFTTRISCPVTTNFSLQDYTDGPHLNISPYNLLTNVAAEDKKYSINPFLGHSSKSGWEKEYMEFFGDYIDKEIINIYKSKYSTYYNSTSCQLPFGLKAATIDGINNETKELILNYRYNGDIEKKSIIPGGTAVIIKGFEGNYKLKLVPENTDESPRENLLHGSDVRTVTTGGNKYYKLSYGPPDSEEYQDKLGWYYGTSDGSSFIIEEHRAWLALSDDQETSMNYIIPD